jgi:hypothetical protein
MHKSKKQIRKENNTCLQCGEKLAINSTRLCEKHLAKQRESGKRTYDKEKKQEYYNKNKKAILKTHQIYEQKMRDSGDLNYRLRRNILSRTADYLHCIRSNKNYSISKNLGCTIPQLKKYLEGLFDYNEEGNEFMSWNNYGINGWHIDHIVPLSKFNLENELEFRLAHHYTNLQPKWAKDNIIKSNNFEDEKLGHIIICEDGWYLITDKPIKK